MKKDTQTPVEATWNLSDMFADVESWQAQLAQAKTVCDKLAAQRGHAGESPSALLQTAQLYEQLNLNIEQLFVFANTNYDQDMSNSQAKDLYETISNEYTAMQERISFLAPELMQMTPEQFSSYCEQCPELRLYEQFAKDFFAKREHILPAEMETLLVRMENLGSSFSKTFDDLTVNDVHFPEVEGPDGTPFTANEANYQQALINSDRDFRARYFNGLLGVYGQHIHTLASLYYGSVKNDVYQARSRRYPSARAMSLDANHVQEAVYDNLIATVREHTGPLQDYVALRQQVLELNDIHFYDLFVPMVRDTERRYSYEEAQELVLKATAVLGEDYTAVLKEAMQNRWIDVYPASNKATGAYSTCAYGFHPYMLLNYTGTLDDVFTLAHELGHSMHSYYSHKNQPYIYADYSIFTAEVASTLNEELLFHYLYTHSSTPAEQALLLSKHLDDIRSTFYRQTMFADFENQTHQEVEQGRPLLPEELCEKHRALNQLYYGPQFTVDESLTYEWARIPHFYRAFYMYQYATGISAAISIARRIREQGAGAVADYRRFLTTGGSNHPIELLKIAGVDMASPKPILDTIADFSETLQKLRSLLGK